VRDPLGELVMRVMSRVFTANPSSGSVLGAKYTNAVIVPHPLARGAGVTSPFSFNFRQQSRRC